MLLVHFPWPLSRLIDLPNMYSSLAYQEPASDLDLNPVYLASRWKLRVPAEGGYPRPRAGWVGGRGWGGGGSIKAQQVYRQFHWPGGQRLGGGGSVMLDWKLGSCIAVSSIPKSTSHLLLSPFFFIPQIKISTFQSVSIWDCCAVERTCQCLERPPHWHEIWPLMTAGSFKYIGPFTFCRQYLSKVLKVSVMQTDTSRTMNCHVHDADLACWSGCQKVNVIPNWTQAQDCKHLMVFVAWLGPSESLCSIIPAETLNPASAQLQLLPCWESLSMLFWDLSQTAGTSAKGSPAPTRWQGNSIQ